MKNEKDMILQSVQKYKNNQRLYEGQKQEWMKQKNKLVDEMNKIRKINEELRSDLEKQKENFRFMEISSKKKKKEKPKPTIKKIEEYPPVKY